MTNSSGTVVWAADYKPFGEVTITVSTITNNLRFPGQYYDAETGLNYNYYRDYNPLIGRYIEADPIGISKGTNHLYVGLENNPIIKTDPSGLQVSGPTGTCKPKSPCQEQYNTAVSNCMKKMAQGPGNMSTLQCVQSAVGIGLLAGAAGAAFGKPAVGGIVGAVGIVYCVANVGPNTAPTTGAGLCQMMNQHILTNCVE